MRFLLDHPFSYCPKQLGARLPQIGKSNLPNSKRHMLTGRRLVKNLQTRCEGLSPAMFFFSIFGNVTFAMAILMKSIERNYLITNASWLAGMSRISGTPERSSGSLPILFHRESVDCLLGRVCKCYAIYPAPLPITGFRFTGPGAMFLLSISRR